MVMTISLAMELQWLYHVLQNVSILPVIFCFLFLTFNTDNITNNNGNDNITGNGIAMVVSCFTTGVHSPNGVTRNLPSRLVFKAFHISQYHPHFRQFF